MLGSTVRGADQFQLYEQTFKLADDEIITILIFKDEEMLEDTNS